MPHYDGAFQVAGWDENTFEETDDGTKLTKARIEQSFTGDFDGTVAWDGVMYYRSDGTAVYSGVQTMKGTLDGREGSAVAISSGEYDGTTATSRWEFVSGSGQGGFEGLAGSGESSAKMGEEGSYSLDVEGG